MPKITTQDIVEVLNNYDCIDLGKIQEFPAGFHIYATCLKRKIEIWLLHPDNIYFRDLQIIVAEEVLIHGNIPPHFARYNRQKEVNQLCLLDKEQYILSSYSFPEYLRIYIDQLIGLFSLSNFKIKEEYLREFTYYWNRYCFDEKSCCFSNVYLPVKRKAQELECWMNSSKEITSYQILSKTEKLNAMSQPSGVKSIAYYIPIEFPVGIIPPQEQRRWGAQDLLNILYNPIRDRVSEDTYKFLSKTKVDTYKKVIVFSFRVPESVEITFSGVITFKDNREKCIIDKVREDFVQFIPMKTTRMDLKYLSERVGQEYVKLPPVLIIGCGSVGSYILQELVKMGFDHIGISDPDIFESGNALRHILGPSYSGKNKAAAMQAYIQNGNPQVRVDIVPDLLSKDEKEVRLLIERFKIIILAVGGTDLQRKFNYLFKRTQSESWFVFNWLDAAGKGSHALVMRYALPGCFNCLFYDHGKPIYKNKISFSDGTEKVVNNGCGGAFTPYGNSVLVRNTSMIVSILRSILEGKIQKNTVISCRHDFTSLKDSITMQPIILDDFAEESCDICDEI